MKDFGALPLQTVSIEAHFKKWGMEFVGEILDPSSASHRWILVATDYFTKWVEIIPTKKATH